MNSGETEVPLEQRQTVQVSIVMQEHGLEAARYPSPRPAVLTVPEPEFDAGL